jgi:hypothetical protein
MLSCIALHESRIADHIGCKNAREPAADAFFVSKSTSQGIIQR